MVFLDGLGEVARYCRRGFIFGLFVCLFGYFVFCYFFHFSYICRLQISILLFVCRLVCLIDIEKEREGEKDVCSYHCSLKLEIRNGCLCLVALCMLKWHGRCGCDRLSFTQSARVT